MSTRPCNAAPNRAAPAGECQLGSGAHQSLRESSENITTVATSAATIATISALGQIGKLEFAAVSAPADTPLTKTMLVLCCIVMAFP